MNASTPNRRNVLSAGACGALLLGSGCASLLTRPPPRLFTLKPPDAPAVAAVDAMPWSLAIGLPEMLQALDTDRIALKRGGFELDYFAGASWSDRLPGLLRGLLLDTIEATGKVAAVIPDTLSLHSDFLLLTQVKDFEAQYPDAGGGPPVIEVRIVAQLARSSDRIVLATLDAHETNEAAANKLDAIIPAFNRSAGAVIGQIAGWAIEQGRHGFKASS